jgi:hypothetical protein
MAAVGRLDLDSRRAVAPSMPETIAFNLPQGSTR